MTSRIVIIWTLLTFCLAIPGYGKVDCLTAAPNNPPKITQMIVHPNPANPGATIILEMRVENAAANLSGGAVIATDSHGNNYQGKISSVEGTPDTFLTSIRLSPLTDPGDLIFEVFILDAAGNLHQTQFLAITIS
ncbi:hypothetical protein U27_03414 [Candidatus Vecturithrix granuli]|uniref:Uncharacterized protein n=1 Tax=Vecturithrix granuli TaxID=1499967 RepID=A0A081BVU7_VECG1|nr:hypothetical protein U27_03414 [Candidatus Vecturithrix granuli]